MKLKFFSSQTLPASRVGGSPKISLTKAGVISFNPAACDLIKLKAPQAVTVAQDEDEPENWYVFLDGGNGFATREGYGKEGDTRRGALLNHRALCEQLLSSFDCDKKNSHSFLIAGQPTMMKDSKVLYWGILIPYPVRKRR